jgi:hypothetical protein
MTRFSLYIGLHIMVYSIHILSSVFVLLYSMKLDCVVGPFILLQLHDSEGLIYGAQSIKRFEGCTK